MCVWSRGVKEVWATASNAVFFFLDPRLLLFLQIFLLPVVKTNVCSEDGEPRHWHYTCNASQIRQPAASSHPSRNRCTVLEFIWLTISSILFQEAPCCPSLAPKNANNYVLRCALLWTHKTGNYALATLARRWIDCASAPDQSLGSKEVSLLWSVTPGGNSLSQRIID